MGRRGRGKPYRSEREQVNNWEVRHIMRMIFQSALGPFPSPDSGQMTPLPRDYLAYMEFLGSLSIVVKGCQHSVLDRSPLHM